MGQGGREGGLGVRTKRFAKCLFGRGERLVGWMLAPSTGRLPREGGSLEGAAFS